jgi:hypothetical protein
MENLPLYVPVIFALTTVATLLLFNLVLRRSASEAARKRAVYVLSGLTAWLAIQAAISVNGVYVTGLSMPPKLFLFGVLPALLVIALLFISKAGRRFIDSLPILPLTYLHVVRVPVEIVLFWLFQNHLVPELMTFEGRNFDIFSGITAPFIAYYGIRQRKLNNAILLTWNFICLALLMNIVVNAILSAPFPFQQFAFDQPNIGVLYFPFSWLPTFIVPVVLFCHLASIRHLLINKNTLPVHGAIS